MKRTSVFLLVLSSFAIAGAQSAPACTDITINLSRGAESASVLKLQQFLFAKGLLKATPNGYFGPATLAGVKAYQKSKGFSQVGNTGPMTRAAIKKETCATGVSTPPIRATTTPVQATSTSPSATSSLSLQASPPVVLLRPVIDSFDLVTLFENGETDWTFNLYGTHFATTTSNIIYFRNTSNRKTYTIGTFASTGGKILQIPKNLTGTPFPCGDGCKEKLPSGTYEVTVALKDTPASEPKIMTIKPFTISATTGAVQGALSSSGTNQRFGTVSFSASESVLVTGASIVTSSSTISGSGITSTTIKNEMTGVTFNNNLLIGSYQSVILGAYVTTNNTKAGDILGSFSVEIYDYIGKKKTKFKSNQFLVTVAGVI